MRRGNEFKDNNLIYFFNAPDSGLRANPPQAELLEAWNNPRYKVYTYTGGNRTGKTTIACILSIATIFGKLPWNDEKINFFHSLPRKVRIVGQGWEDHIAKVVIPELKKWWPANREVKTKKNNQGVEHVWTDAKTGGTIEIMSNNQDSEQFEGWQGDLVYYDEPPKRDVRVANARGLVDRLGREIFAATLLKEPWVHQDVIHAVDDDGRPDMTVFNVTATIYDNVGYGITQEGIEQFEKTLTEDEKDARLRGVPSYMSGLVLPKWKRNTHLVERFPVPLNWMIDILIDVHPRERQAILFTATAEDGRKYLVNEIWDHGDGKWIADNIVRCVRQNCYRVNRVAIDPLAKGDSNQDHTTYDQIALRLSRHDMLLETASKDKDNGILLIKDHLCGPNGLPSLFVFDDLVRTIKELEGWMWDEKTQKAVKCVIGSTVIDTPAGRYRIKDMVGQEPWVYTYSHDTGAIDVRRATDIRKTGEKEEVWKLTMDRGVLFATPDHLVMLRNGTYKQLKDLKPYESLMPLYRNMSVDGYTRIKTNRVGERNYQYPGEHRYVYECVYGEIPDGYHIHHKDGNYLNHTPENLESISLKDHAKLHLKNNVGDRICPTCGKYFRQNKVWQKFCSESCRVEKRKKQKVDKMPVRIALCPVCNKTYRQKHHAQIYCGTTCRDIHFRENRKSWPSYNREKKQLPNNHKVVSVGFYGYEDVYCMNVEDTHNFCADGVFIHNCDDHFCENLYRTLLLDTKYCEPEDEEDDFVYIDNRNAITGY